MAGPHLETPGCAHFLEAADLPPPTFKFATGCAGETWRREGRIAAPGGRGWEGGRCPPAWLWGEVLRLYSIFLLISAFVCVPFVPFCPVAKQEAALCPRSEPQNAPRGFVLGKLVFSRLWEKLPALLAPRFLCFPFLGFY